ncbi:MAG TPA: IS200/IS605 family transposase [Anaerolineales bacterium]|nr:IS200/IS605 family transposase [Anaerolineales bacterium]
MPSTTTTQRTKSDTTPQWVVNPDVAFETVSRDPYELSYACLVIPRFSTHYLIGDLADNLYDWMKQICVSFGWRLDYVSVRPDYLQWILRVLPSTSPAYFMNVTRRQTSQEILENFPRFKKENRSRDFWAPGYLVIVSTSPHPSKMINDYIRLTRQQQGILDSRD